MKKKVLLTGILSIVMCLSLIVGATLALFTSESKVNIAITSGKVEVTASVAVDSVKYVTGTNATWTSATNGETSFDGIGSSAKVTESSVKLNNIVPGDGLKFNVVVNNGSTVSAKSRIIVENDITKDTGLFDLLQVKVGEQDFNGSNVGNWQLIEPNSADVIIPVEIVFPSSCEEQGLGCEINLVVEAIQGNVEVKDSIADNGDNTYTINDKHGLIAFAKSVNAGNNYAGKTVTLATDVDLANGKWTPISSSEANLFNGTFDGGNYTISNLKVEGENHVGLFGVLKNDNATIKNVKIHNVDLKGTTYLGAVVGLLRNGNVENCHVSGTIKMEGNYMVGGIAGTGSHGIIKGCTVDGTDKNVSYLKATYLAQDIEGDKVGGIAGHTESGNVDRVVDCTVSNITIEGTRSLGGAVGTVNINVSIKNTSVSNVIVKSNASDDYAESQKISASAFCGEIFGGTSTTLNGTVENVTVIGKQAKYTGVAYGRNRASEVVDGSTINVTANNVDITILVSTNTELTTASADAFDGMVIAFENDIVGDSILDQKENVDVVIDGANYKYTGTMDIYGHARHTGTETLTIKNVNFVADENIDFISCNTTDGEKRYAHNVTVEDCNFNATTENGVEAVGMRFRQCYNITVKNVTAEGMHSLMWATGVANGINLEKIVMEDCLNGVSFGTSIDVSLKNVTIEATDDYSYGIRADFSGAYELTVEDCNITASAPVLLRYATSTATATFVGNNVLTANNVTTNPDGYQVIVTETDFKEGATLKKGAITIVNGSEFNTYFRTSVSDSVATSANKTTEETTVSANGYGAQVPTGTTLKDGQTSITLNVEEEDANTGTFEFGNDAETYGYSISIPEVAEDNTAPIVVTINAKAGLDNVVLLHKGNLMTAVDEVGAVDADNEYYYDKATGVITLATTNFSNFTLVSVNIDQAKEVTSADQITGSGKFVLNADITVAETLVINGYVEIDLNNKTITGTMNKSVGAVIKNQGVLVLKNGTVKSTASNGGSAILNNGTATLEKVTLNGAPNADGKWPSYTVNNVGVMTITDSLVTSVHGAICSYNGGDLTLNNVNVDMSGIPGFTSHGIYTYDGGIVTVNGGTIENKATDQNSSGASVINGAVVVNDGTFSGRLENYYDTPVLMGGTYSENPKAIFVADGYKVVDNGNGTWSVVAE